MTTESSLQLAVKSVLEDVLQQQGNRTRDSRQYDGSSLKRFEAAGWLRKTVGVVGGKDLPAEPSEKAFRHGLRSGIILCNVLNKVQPGSVPKVVEGTCDPLIVPDGGALSAFQYFENVRNFRVAIEEMGLPSFEASDFEEDGKSSRIVNCVLALKSYSEWKQNGAIGSWKYSPNPKPSCFGSRKTGEPFMKSFDSLSTEQSDSIEAGSVSSFGMLVRAALSDKNQEEIPIIVESMINKLTEEFERRLSTHNEQTKSGAETMEEYVADNCVSQTGSCDDKAEEIVEDETSSIESERKEIHDDNKSDTNEESLQHVPKQQASVVDKSDINEEPVQHVSKQQASVVNKSDTNEESVQHVSKQQASVVDKSDTNEESVQHVTKQQALVDDKSDTNEELVQLVLKQQAFVERQQAFVERQQAFVARQRRDIQELKHCLHSTKDGMQVLQTTYQEDVSSLGKHMSSLANAASGYQRVLEENRKLYNQVQDLKGNIRVYCRVRPFVPGQSNTLSSVDSMEDRTISIVTHSKQGKEAKKTFTFNKIFTPSVTQAEVFCDMQPLIRSVLDGYNVCIFAYGQTGSGKTHTMTGPKELTEETVGVNYRALGDLFQISNQRKDTIAYDISVQMLEIYNEQVRDLLSDDGGNKRLEIRNSSQNGINVPDANLVRVSSTSDVINLMNLGHKNRAVCSTALNDRSSRSHSCLTVHVQGKDLSSGNIIRGSMHLVDLAGSERVDKSEVTGNRLKEAQHINKSLAALGDVIASLASRSSHVPYRNSKLTQLLQDSLGGQAKTLMFVHIAPEYEALGETVSTLKFAERVATVELGAAKVNKDTGEVKELKEQIVSLKAALARKEAESENLKRTPSRSGSPERSRSTLGSTPCHPKWKSLSDISCSFENIEFESSSSSRRESLESQDNHHALSVANDDDVESSASGEWVDKVVVNKQDNIKKDQNLKKTCSEQGMNRLTANKKGSQDYDMQRTRSEVSYNDESDRDTVNSDCSETDLFSSGNAKINTSPNLLASKLKKQQVRTTKSTEFRSSIPSLIPSPSIRKPSNGVNPNPQKAKKKTGINK